MSKQDMELLISNYMTVFNSANSDVFIATADISSINSAIGKSVINFMRRRKIDDVIHDLDILIKDIQDLEDVYEHVEGFVWNNEIITPEIFEERRKHRILYSDEAFFLKTKEAEISLLIALFQLKSQYVIHERDDRYFELRDDILVKLVDCRAKFVFYKQNLSKTSLSTNISLDTDKFETCGIYFKENIRNDDTSLSIDHRELKDIISKLKANGMLLDGLTESQKEVMSIEVLSPAYFTNAKDKEMLEDREESFKKK